MPPSLTSKEKPAQGPVPINSSFAANSTPVISSRDFQPVPAPTVFSNQDVDLRLGGADPRLSRLGDQDMRTLPGQLPNPLPPPLESYVT